jgi:hypothetical protein
MKRLKHAKEYIETIRALAPLLRAYPPLAVLQVASLCDYAAWYWNRGTMAYVIDDFGQPQGVCLVKLFRRLEQFLEPFVHEPCGRFCMLELMVAKTPDTMGWICEELTRRWGRQEVILWDRGERTEQGAPRMFKWKDFQKLARRITHGAIETCSTK